jgi:dihydrofolate reductase
MAQAKAAAGDGDVAVQGACTAQRTLEASVLEEPLISHVPELFGAGPRLIDVLPSEVELEVVRVIGTPEATHLRYRVRR